MYTIIRCKCACIYVNIVYELCAVRECVHVFVLFEIGANIHPFTADILKITRTVNGKCQTHSHTIVLLFNSTQMYKKCVKHLKYVCCFVTLLFCQSS